MCLTVALNLNDGNVVQDTQCEERLKAENQNTQGKKFQYKLLFNVLPKEVRNLFRCSIDDLKAKLEKFLRCVTDKPKTHGLVSEASNQCSAIPSNSLVDKSRIIKLNGGS